MSMFLAWGPLLWENNYGVRHAFKESLAFEMAHIVKDQGMKALSDPEFLGNRLNSMIFGTSQALTVVFAVFISILKPWRKKKKR